ncbi:hypothetical protein LIPSTDRAFT_284106 [Lipomyces starkeyi NRRL Y-11557]|uniref:Uncharacterized protein n=1 Tax=Lipomyces starkeyi NRRL Y-11557 TaxID=675824 RepID=A0A1E3Q5U4_LIPST|nr:hypothetical protein LIPSTDRAFT_284106 [Lipomyces starkeyi NRRL Y-11557]
MEGEAESLVSMMTSLKDNSGLYTHEQTPQMRRRTTTTSSSSPAPPPLPPNIRYYIRLPTKRTRQMIRTHDPRRRRAGLPLSR